MVNKRLGLISAMALSVLMAQPRAEAQAAPPSHAGSAGAASELVSSNAGQDKTTPPAQAAAPTAPSWSPVFTGSYFTRYELRRGYDDLALSSASSRPRLLEGDAFYYRVRFGIGTGLIKLSDRIKGGLQFTPQTTGTFGNLSNTPGAPQTVIDANLSLHEGYARVQGNYARFDAGRFEMNYGDSVVIGNLDWNEVGRTFDGFRARIATSASSPWLDLFLTVLDEGRPDILRGQTLDSSPGVGLGDTYFLGAYGALGPLLGHGMDLDVYALARTWADAKDVRLNAMSPLYRREHAADMTLGVRVKQRVGLFDYRFEGGVQAGTRPGAAPTASTVDPAAVVQHAKARAYHADLELGSNFAEDRLRIGAELIYASGDDPNTKGRTEGWDELYPTAHRTLGLTDAFVQNGQKRTNVLSGLLHVTGNPWKPLTMHADGILFSRPEHSVQYKNQKGISSAELDVGATLTIAKGLKLRGTYGVFFPRNRFYRDVLPNPQRGPGTDPVHFAELELRYTFE